MRRYQVTGSRPVFGAAPGDTFERSLAGAEWLLVGSHITEVVPPRPAPPQAEPAAEPDTDTTAAPAASPPSRKRKPAAPKPESEE